MPGIRLYGDTATGGGTPISGSGGQRLYDPSDVWESKPQVSEPSKAMELFPGTMEQLADLQVDPFSLKADSKKVISDYFSGIKESIVGAGESLRGAFDEAKGGTFSGTVGKSLETGARTIGAVLSPVTSAFQAAENLPGWGSVAKLINTAFGALGEGTTAVSNAAIDKLPVSNEVKENIKPGIAEALTLATQILVGGAVEKGFRIGKPKIDELTNKYGKEDAQTIVEKAVEIAKEQKPEVKLAETTGKGTRIYEPMKPQGTGELRTAGRARSIEETAIEKGIVDKFEGLPEYQQMNMKEQYRLSEDLIKSNPDLARAVALGKEAPPQGILPEMVSKAMEDQAAKVGDVTTLRDLANSNLVLEDTSMGQRLRALAERDPNSPVTAMVEIRKARQEKVVDVKKSKTKVKEEIKKEIKKPTKEDWSSFIDELVC